jgi:hypothetical protein
MGAAIDIPKKQHTKEKKSMNADQITQAMFEAFVAMNAGNREYAAFIWKAGLAYGVSCGNVQGYDPVDVAEYREILELARKK